MISAWLHDEPEVARTYVTETVDTHEQIADLSLISAALVRCWAGTIGCTPEELLTDLAIGQALENAV